MSFGRLTVRSLSVTLGVVLLAALLPMSSLAAPDTERRNYIVTLSVADSGRLIEPAGKSARKRIERRSERTASATDRIAREKDIKVRRRFDSSVTGFSAKMTPQKAAAVAADASVVSVRPARKLKLSGQTVPVGIKRVKAWAAGTTPGADVNANVAVIDTGIGPGDGDGWPLAMTNVSPQDKPELNIVGGYNCTSGQTGAWADGHGHGTHVAGTVGARDNNVGTIGVAPGVRLWAVKVFAGSYGDEAGVLCGLQWAIGTHANGDPSDDIDVINMSMEGSRLDYDENCATAADDIQRLICEANDRGISVVAAAGNAGGNANHSMPGGFDQVISVGAFTDTDGEGRGTGHRVDCSGYRTETDDDYADYSNYGSDIDIVAPGTCVASTSASDQSGNTLVTMTGTSMAAPHVTGAVARYVATRGRPTSARMRRIIRAAGRMDWDPKSDPLWSGVNDPQPPNRVLDVSALIGPASVKTFVYHDSFQVGAGAQTRTTRVDVQRGGGFEGTVKLKLSGLSGGVGSASFSRVNLPGLGPNDLGATLKLKLRAKGRQGVHDLGVIVNGSGVTRYSRDLRLTVDRTGPSVSGLKPNVRDSRVAVTRPGSAQAFVHFKAKDKHSGIKSIKLQRKIGKGAWHAAGVMSATNGRVRLQPGKVYKFRVRATDSVGNKSVSPVISATLAVRDSQPRRWNLPPGGAWQKTIRKKAIGGSVLQTSGRSPALTARFSGKSVALVAPVGPYRGTMRVRIDSGRWVTVDLSAAQSSDRRVVWSRRVNPGGHTISIRGISGLSAVDALLIIK